MLSTFSGLAVALLSATVSAGVIDHETGPQNLVKRRGPGEFHYGVAYGEPFDLSTGCDAFNLIAPELVMNWGPDNRHDKTFNVCNRGDAKFIPNLWGRDFDMPQLSATPNNTPPWGVMLENEVNWWGGYSPGADHGYGANLTAQQCADRYYKETDLINSKWGVGKVKLFTPSPVNLAYPRCTGPQPAYGCTWQTQYEWFDDYFNRCPNCLHDAWAINFHEYSCDMGQTISHLQGIMNKYPNKNIFVGELGCDGPSPDVQGQYLIDFANWAYGQQYVVGFIWAGINSVGSAGAQLVQNGQLTAVGRAYKTVQQRYPVKDRA